MNYLLMIFILRYPTMGMAHDITRILASNPYSHIDNYLDDLQKLLIEILKTAHPKHCLAIITDDFHYAAFHNQEMFLGIQDLPLMYYFIKANLSEDLLAPNYQTVKVLKEMHAHNCDFYLVILNNGEQAARLLRFVDKHRIFKTDERRFVILYDKRLLLPHMFPIWNNMVATIFLKHNEDNSYDIFTTEIFEHVLVTHKIRSWRAPQLLKHVHLFPDKATDLKGAALSVAVYEHVPMVMVMHRNDSGKNIYTGVEVEIIKALGRALNFEPHFYQTLDSKIERWGRQLPNGKYTGLIGQLTNRSAKIAIGNLHLFQLYFPILDLSRSHSHECLTFLTPESSQDNAWRTLIQPFSSGMWAGVLISLFFMGSIFYFMSLLHALLLNRNTAAALQFRYMYRKCLKSGASSTPCITTQTFRSVRFRVYINRLRVLPNEEDLFDNFANCILLTSSMLLCVSLPRIPRNWPLRILTGWYWLYCILVTVTYRSSFTALLANPTPRITINTLEELVGTSITTTAWGKENKKFFDEAFDDMAQEIGRHMEIIDDIEDITKRIAEGSHAYYDNIYFLRDLRHRSKKRAGAANEVLHIMQECVVNMPVALGLEKNSPLRKNINKYIQRLIESGLIAKWLQDYTAHLPAEEQTPPEALINLEKFWSSFVAVVVGYFLAALSAFWEYLHFKRVVQNHPLYDIYNTSLYYKFKRRFPYVRVKQKQSK